MPTTQKIKDVFKPLLETVHARALYNNIQIVGFKKSEEELIRATMSRVPPALMTNVKLIFADRTMGAKHGRFYPDEGKIAINPLQFDLRQRFGQGPGWIMHFELTMCHEFGHSIYEGLPNVLKQQWNDISGWIKTKDTPPGYKRYVEKRPGWEIGKTSQWCHKPGVGFTRHYAERNPNEDFADSFAFFMLNKPHQMAPDKRTFLEDLIKNKIHTYPSPLIQGPTKAYGERGN